MGQEMGYEIYTLYSLLGSGAINPCVWKLSLDSYCNGLKGELGKCVKTCS